MYTERNQPLVYTTCAYKVKHLKKISHLLWQPGRNKMINLCLCVVLCRYQHAVANPGLITFTGPYLDVGGAGYVVTISHTIHASR